MNEKGIGLNAIRSVLGHSGTRAIEEYLRQLDTKEQAPAIEEMN